ncbi:YicC family protein [Enterococcus faecium]|nr:YicC family protein [Enterococcus faecium]
MKSMTGFGKAIRETKAYQLDIEIKSVNQRFLDVQIRSPKILNFIENDFRQLIKQQLSRGRIEVFVNLAYIGKNEKQIVINWELIDSLITQLTDGIQQRYGSQNQVSIRRLAERFALDENFVTVDVTVEEKPEESMEELAQLALDTLKSALDSIEASREKEGQALASVLKKNTEEFKQVLKKLNSFVDVYEQEFQLRYQKKLEEFLGAKVDEQRLLTELAILLERGDIHEELDRLAIHVQKLDELIEAQCPVGRELDFLIQEMNREINTIGSKSNAIEIKNQVVQSKTILEKIREQVQNIE